MIVLQGQLAADEAKYAGYFRQTVKNCHGAMTTSPVEGHNRVLKHGPLKIHQFLGIMVIPKVVWYLTTITE